ncbi:hypothetical protein K491DRAFT_5062 [Lophiostoma macrostomum CBS 122681]|uniref:Uncharacterized protein n=1 Tax=Lophiostoma macrostomum CBS 122681 TaxID=1314788 RepID=A0A6A6TST1_9PLEO|nr:hypothetical protein K491DRAFT_5062 [Lophiostoma macrostomum CBS 122681]
MELVHTNIPPKFYSATVELEIPAHDLKRLPNGLLDMAHMPASIASISQHNATASPLLRLPGEIRDKIYSSILTSVEFEVYTFNSIPYRISAGPGVTSKRAIGLPSVCRQLYADTSLLLFSKPTFTFPRFGVETCRKWVATLSETQRGAVRKVKCWYYMCNEDFTKMFPGLRVLVAMRYASSPKLDGADLRRIREVQGVGVEVEMEYLDE